MAVLLAPIGPTFVVSSVWYYDRLDPYIRDFVSTFIGAILTMDILWTLRRTLTATSGLRLKLLSDQRVPLPIFYRALRHFQSCYHPCPAKFFRESLSRRYPIIRLIGLLVVAFLSKNPLLLSYTDNAQVKPWDRFYMQKRVARHSLIRLMKGAYSSLPSTAESILLLMAMNLTPLFLKSISV